MNNSIWALWLTLSYEVANMYFSVGIVTALTFGVIILLRPVTNPLLEPQDRVRLWSFGWYCSYLVYFWALYGRVKILPWSFRGLLRLRLHDPIQSPTILPDPWAEGAQDTLALPGGLRISCPLSREQMMLIGPGVAGGHDRDVDLVHPGGGPLEALGPAGGAAAAGERGGVWPGPQDGGGAAV